MSRNGHTKPTPKKVYMTNMCDHAYVLAAALQAHGTPAEVLPHSDDESMAIGIELCGGSECMPCFTTMGDYIRLGRRPDFDPKQSRLLLATTGGSCRFGQYNVLQHHILAEHGMGDLELFTPTAMNSYQDLGENSMQIRQLIWQGFVAVDLLQKLLHEHRPYELHPGQTDQVYQRCLDRVVAATEAGGDKKLVEAMKWVARQFEMLPVNRSQSRPLIGIVGEIYVRFNIYSNMDIIRKVEMAGGEGHLASMMEWIYYTNWEYERLMWLQGNYMEFFKTFVTDGVQRRDEHNLVKPVAHLLKHPEEPRIGHLMDVIRPYYDPALSNETVLSLGKAIELVKSHGVCGIINIMPFACMPGIITGAVGQRVRADLENVPWLDISYDAQGGTNINTRLEAFMYQAMQFERRTMRV